MDRIKAVIFDLDGVLVDSADWHYQALSRALANHGFSLPREEHARHYEGLPTREKLRLLSSEKGLPAALHAPVNELKQRYTLELITRNCRPRASHIEMLARLKAENYRLAVASNSIRKTIEAALAGSGIAGSFDFCLSNQDVSRPKPDPQIYQDAFAKLKMEPGECLILEDHPAGLKAAYASGAHVAKVENIKAVCYAFIKFHISAIGRERG